MTYSIIINNKFYGEYPETAWDEVVYIMENNENVMVFENHDIEPEYDEFDGDDMARF